MRLNAVLKGRRGSSQHTETAVCGSLQSQLLGQTSQHHLEELPAQPTQCKRAPIVSQDGAEDTASSLSLASSPILSLQAEDVLEAFYIGPLYWFPDKCCLIPGHDPAASPSFLHTTIHSIVYTPVVRGQVICYLSPEGTFSAARTEMLEMLWAPSIVFFEVLRARAPHFVEMFCTSTRRVLLKMIRAATAVLLMLRATARPLLLKVFRATTQNVLWESFWTATAVLLLFRCFDDAFLMFWTWSFQVMIRTARTPGLLEMLGADAPVLLMLRASFTPSFLQMFWARTWVVFMMIWTVCTSRAGSTAPITNISHVSAGGS